MSFSAKIVGAMPHAELAVIKDCGHITFIERPEASAWPRLLQRIADLLFWEPAHWVMQTRRFVNLTRRAERE